MADKIPDSMHDIDKWRLSRRRFIKGIAIAGAVSQLPWWVACSDERKEKKAWKASQSDMETIEAVQQVLLPDDGFGPGAKEINAKDYLLWVLSDERMDEEDKTFIINGLEWINKRAEEEFAKRFYELDEKSQKMVVTKASALDYGETWLSVMMTFILEALLSNPLYGGNPRKSAWKWLNHYAGSPQPTEELLYPEIFKTFENNL